MLIINDRVPTTVPFKDILAGECFIDQDNRLNIKIDVSLYEETEEYRPNAVALDNGEAWWYDDDEQVTAVKARTIIVS